MRSRGSTADAAGLSKVELHAALRRDFRAGLSNRAPQGRYGVGWRTANQALSSAWPQSGAPYSPHRSKLEPFEPVIDELVLLDLDAPRKHDLANQVVRGYFAKCRSEIWIEAGRGPPMVVVPQSHLPGAEVDFGELVIRLRGES